MSKKAARGPQSASNGVGTFLATLDHPAKREVLALRAIILGADDSIREEIKWNAPSFYTTEHFATFHLRHSDGVQIVLHLGAKPRGDLKVRAAISDPEVLLEWRGADRATVTFRDLSDIEKRQRAFLEVLRQWITHV